MDFSRAITQPPYGVVGWRLMYLSTDALGRPMAVTGTVLLRPDQAPTQGFENRPIITYGQRGSGPRRQLRRLTPDDVRAHR